jgi:ketosteroid isomerase-like protein
MSQENVELSRNWGEAFNRRDFDAIRRLNHPQISWRTAVEDPDATTHHGREAVHRYLEDFIEALPLTAEAQERFELPDGRVFTTVRFVGKSASGVPIDYPLTTVTTIEQGMVIHVDEYRDRADAFQAVGLSEQGGHADS